MKPTRNRIFCYGCRKAKILFESQAKADNFIRFNNQEILEESSKAPVRSYYCELCGGYHVTSNPSIEKGEAMDEQIKSKVNNYLLEKQIAPEALALMQTIYNKLNEIKIALNYGLIQEADKTLKSCHLDLENLIHWQLPKLKQVTLQGKIKKASAQIKEMQSIINQQDETILAAISNQDKIENLLPSRHTLSNILLMRQIDRRLVEAQKLLGEEHQAARRLLFNECREMTLKFAGIGKQIMIKNINQKINRYASYIKHTTSEVSSTQPIPATSLSADPEEKQNNSRHISKTDQQQLLSIIDRIEQIAVAYQSGDLETCETQLEIASFLLDNLNQENEYTTLLNKQLDKWRSFFNHH